MARMRVRTEGIGDGAGDLVGGDDVLSFAHDCWQFVESLMIEAVEGMLRANSTSGEI
jgi:hypothetical protein